MNSIPFVSNGFFLALEVSRSDSSDSFFVHTFFVVKRRSPAYNLPLLCTSVFNDVRQRLNKTRLREKSGRYTYPLDFRSSAHELSNRKYDCVIQKLFVYFYLDKTISLRIQYKRSGITIAEGMCEMARTPSFCLFLVIPRDCEGSTAARCERLPRHRSSVTTLIGSDGRARYRQPVT